ncbi:hypothetical protein ScPMuIL_008877 [Solemya velum]
MDLCSLTQIVARDPLLQQWRMGVINVDLWGQEAIDEEMFQSIIQDLGLSTHQSNPVTDNPTSSDSGAVHGRHRFQLNPVTDNPTSSDSGAAHGRHRLELNPATDNPTSSDSGAVHGRHRFQLNPVTDNPTSSDSGAAHDRHRLQLNHVTYHSKRSRHHFKKNADVRRTNDGTASGES